MKKILSLLLLLSLCNLYGYQDNDTVYYKKLHPLIKQKGNKNESITYYALNDDITVKLDSKTRLFNVMSGDKQLLDWTPVPDSYYHEYAMYIYHASNNYYLLFNGWFEDSDWYHVYHINRGKLNHIGVFQPEIDKQFAYYESDRWLLKDYHENNSTIVYVLDNQLVIAEATVAGKEIYRYFSGKSDSAADTKDYTQEIAKLTIIDKMDFVDNLVLEKEFDLNLDDAMERYRIDWKNKKISYLNNAARDLYENDLNDNDPHIYFRQDTLIINETSFDNMPSVLHLYKKKVQFVIAPSGLPELEKVTYSVENGKSSDECGNYEIIYYKQEGITLQDITFSHEDFTIYPLSDKTRNFTLHFLTKQLGGNHLFNYCLAPPTQHELWLVLLKEPLSIKNVVEYNNIAYYLQRLDKDEANYVSAYLLEKILEKFPNRTVAHINLADAYWETGNKERAIPFYSSYKELMKKENEQSKIPQRVYDRFK